MRLIYSKSFIIFSICLLAVIFLIFLQSKGWLFSFQTLSNQAPRPIIFVSKKIILPVKNFFATIYQLNNIVKENNALKNNLRELQLNQTEFEQLRKENQALRAELGFSRQSPYKLLPCTVISQNAFGFTDQVVINCGTNQGIILGQAVVSQGFLVGKVIYAGSNSSSIILCTSSNFISDARISTNNSTGIVKGSFNTGLTMEQIPQNDNLEKNWPVVTAGISENIPKNIPIGKIGEVLSSSTDLFKKVTLISPLDFNNLDFVFVVKQ